jgi:hypothetical protein
MRVIPTEIGGCCGGKSPGYLEPLAIVLSKKSGRPVKMVMDRDEEFRATGPTSGCHIKMKLGARRDGTLVAASTSMWYEAGAYRGSPYGAAAMCALACYNVPNFFIESHDVVVNKPRSRRIARRIAHGDVCHRVARRRNRATFEHGSLELRLKNAAVARRRSRAMRAKMRSDRVETGPRSGAGASALVRAAQTESGPRRRLRVLVQRGVELQRHCLSRQRWQRHRRHG